MLNSILVPLDGSTFGEAALPLALSLARKAKASLRFVHVHESLAPVAPNLAQRWPVLEDTLNPMMKQRDRVYLEGVANRVAKTGVSVDSVLLEGPIADAILEDARAKEIGLIVMATHGRGALARAWLGSVADELVRRMPVPVILVRPSEVKPDLEREQSVHRLVIPLDGSSLAEKIIEPAVEIGTLTKAQFTLVRVIPPMVFASAPVDSALPIFDRSILQRLETYHKEDQQEAQKYLEGIAQRLRARSLNVTVQVVSHEQPAVAILDEVKGKRADLVALATHGRSGWNRLVLGSVADKVIRGASIPVLILRAEDQGK
jgi:nucleotide-binding universal stress UspA family protein